MRCVLPLGMLLVGSISLAEPCLASQYHVDCVSHATSSTRGVHLTADVASSGEAPQDHDFVAGSMTLADGSVGQKSVTYQVTGDSSYEGSSTGYSDFGLVAGTDANTVELQVYWSYPETSPGTLRFHNAAPVELACDITKT